MVLQLVDPRTQRKLPEYLVEHENNIWVADVSIFMRVAAFVEDVVGVYDEMKGTEEELCRTVILVKQWKVVPKISETCEPGRFQLISVVHLTSNGRDSCMIGSLDS